MSLTPSFYPGRSLPPNLIERLRSLLGFFLLSAIVGGSIYIFVNWRQNSQLFGFNPYKNVALLELLSFGNFFDGKKICTKGYYVQTATSSILKVSLAEDEFTRSAWVNNLQNLEIIPQKSVETKAVIATICGHFESRRGGEFGIPPVWIHQITVENFKTEGDPFTL